MFRFLPKIAESLKDLFVIKLLWAMVIIGMLVIMVVLRIFFNLTVEQAAVFIFFLLLPISMNRRFYDYPKFFLGFTAFAAVVGFFIVLRSVPKSFFQYIASLPVIHAFDPVLAATVFIIAGWAFLWAILTIILMQARRRIFGK